jgi:hypothetical protein
VFVVLLNVKMNLKIIFFSFIVFSYIDGSDHYINISSYFENQENTRNDDDDIIHIPNQCKKILTINNN